MADILPRGEWWTDHINHMKQFCPLPAGELTGQKYGGVQFGGDGSAAPYLFSAVVGTARCAVRAPFEGRNVCVTCTCGAIGSARSDAGGDIAARCPHRLLSAQRESLSGGR